MGRASSTKLPAMRDTCHAHLARRPDHAELHALLVIVVCTVLRVGDADVHVEAAGKELDPLDGETHDALRLDRHGHTVDERVRSKNADAVVAIEVHAEDGVAHALRIAI